MKAKYIVLIPFTFEGKNYKPGNILTEDEIKNIPDEIVKKNFFVRDYRKINFAIPFGLIFLSKEFPHPEGCEEETRTETLRRLLCEQKNCKTK